MSTLIEDCKNIIKRLGLDEKLDGNTVKLVNECEHEERTMQGDGFTYVVCSKCGAEL